MTEGPPDRFDVDFTGQTLLDVYRVEQKIAEGGMGAIYAARDENLDCPVVVKVPHPRFLGEPAFVARFSREVEELIRLEHPHIARILARGEHDGVPFFVLQYLGGGSLEDRLGESEGSPESRLGWLDTVAETLDHVHDKGIVHRDIKPANILFDEAGNVFLSDFGVAKVVEAESGITGTGVGIGSPRYMAPEQGKGTKVGPAADQYALAATVYEVLAGRPPFESENPLEILIEKSKAEAPSLAGHAPEVPPRAARAVMKALALDPSDRFASCAEFAVALRAGLAPAPGRARRVVGIALVVLVTGILAFFGLLEDGDPATAVVLLSPGAEPRAVLRYSVKPDRVQRIALTMSMTSRTAAGLRQPPPETVASELRMRGEEGEIPFRWHITSGSHRGVAANGRMTRSGILEALVLESNDRPDVDRIAAVFRQLPVPLPEEPVGVGAIWELTETATLLDSRVIQTVRYKLLSREEDRLFIQISSAEAAPPEEILSLGAGKEVRLNSFFATTSGLATVDLALPLPEQSTSRLKMNLAGLKNDEPIHIDFELMMKLQTR
jgi:hypothetical protein